MANRRIPSLAALRGFEAVARHSSFTAAAAELGVTQGAVSYQIKQLEAEFCTSLFHRKGRVITLTEPARRLLPVLQKSFRDIGTAVAELRSEFSRTAPDCGAEHLFCSSLAIASTRALLPTAPTDQTAAAASGAFRQLRKQRRAHGNSLAQGRSTRSPRGGGAAFHLRFKSGLQSTASICEATD